MWALTLVVGVNALNHFTDIDFTELKFIIVRLDKRLTHKVHTDFGITNYEYVNVGLFMRIGW